MKKLTTITVLLLITIFSLKAQEVPEVQRSMITKVTATWCPNCGSWGWDFFEDILDDNEGEKAVFFGAHHSGDLASSPGASFSSNFNAPYQPYFYVGNQDMNVTSGNGSSKRQEVKNLVDANYLESPIANVGFEANLSDNTLTVSANTKFFQEVTGQYFLGLYILENGVINNQSSNSSMAVHPYVLRSSFTPMDFGLELYNGTISEDTEIGFNFVTELEAAWNKDSITVAGIIWEKNGDTYNFVNVNSTRDFDANTTSTTLIEEDILEVKLYPTIAKKQTTLEMELKQNVESLSINLLNLNGQTLSNIYQGQLSTGIQNFDISLENYEAGIYFIHVQSIDGSVLTKKIIKH